MRHYDDGIFGSDEMTLDEVASGENYVRTTPNGGIMPLRVATTQPLSYLPYDRGVIPPSTQLSDVPATGRPWWQWLLFEAGIGAAVHLIKKSGLVGNPEKESAFDIRSKAAAIAVQARIPVILWGPPGIGKTEWIIALGKVLGVTPDDGLEIVLGSTKDPTDIAGTLLPTGGRSVETIPPKWADDIRKRSRQDLPSLLFLDEFSLTTPMVQGALLRVIRDKVAGDVDLEEGCPGKNCVAVVAAANRPEDTPNALPLPPPSANRLIHIDWPSPDKLVWVKGMLLGWDVLAPDLSDVKLAKNWKQSRAMKQTRKDVADFMALQSISVLSTEKLTEAEGGGAWPSPRSWDNAALALGAARSVNASIDVQRTLVAGAVGDAQALSFFAYLLNRDLPDPEDILKDPTGWKPPENQWLQIKDEEGNVVDKKLLTRNDVIFAVVTSVATAVDNKFSIDRWKKAWDFLTYLTDVTGEQSHGVVFIAGASLMKMVGKKKGLNFGVVEKHLTEDRLGALYESLQSAGIVKFD